MPIINEAQDGLIKAIADDKEPNSRFIKFGGIIIICTLCTVVLVLFKMETTSIKTQRDSYKKERDDCNDKNTILMNKQIESITSENKRLTDRQLWQDSVNNAINKIKNKIP